MERVYLLVTWQWTITPCIGDFPIKTSHLYPFIADFPAMHVWRAGHLWAHWCHNGSTAAQEQLVALLGLFVELRRLVEEQQRLGPRGVSGIVSLWNVWIERVFSILFIQVFLAVMVMDLNKSSVLFLIFLFPLSLSLSSLKSVPVIMRLILLYYSCIRRLILISYWSPSKYRDAFGIWFQR